MTALSYKLVTGAALAAVFVIAGCGEAPPQKSQQTGYRGTGMVQISDPTRLEKLAGLNVVPEEPYAREEGPVEGPTAGEFYQNVQVLRDISPTNFNRLMTAITEWVVPESYRNDPNTAGGCNYCHNPENMASDEVYTKVVARKMFQMTQTINAEWKDHVAGTGVTCYTCHRGQFIPANVWSDAAPDPRGSQDRWIGGRNGQNTPGQASVGYSTLPENFRTYLMSDGMDAYLQTSAKIRVTPRATYRGTTEGTRIRDAENTYGLMMHMSQSLGVNCTFCHNTGSFKSWTYSPPQRMTAYYGLGMVGQVNTRYMEPLTSTFAGGPNAAHRLGPQGDVLKVNCTTCHQGANKPLNGAQMAAAYPELTMRTGAPGAQPGDGPGVPAPAPAAAPAPEAAPAVTPASAPGATPAPAPAPM
jgi:photosynthetic reaction center cytochrome c subunit